MPCKWLTFAMAATVMAAIPVFGQSAADTMSPAQVALACAPPARLSPPPSTAVQITGTTDTMARTLFGAGDTVIVAAGTKSGVTVGQRYFVRRSTAVSSDMYAPGMTYDSRAAGHVVRTVGWIRIVSAADATAIATIEHACDAMTSGDFLEPFAAPTVPAAPAKPGDLDFSSPARVLFGDLQQSSAATGEFVLADRAAPTGARFAIYRDLRVPNLPLTNVGQAVVVAEGPTTAVLRIVQARDAVFSGDYLVPEKKQ